jgi:hypothetical protein
LIPALSILMLEPPPAPPPSIPRTTIPPSPPAICRIPDNDTQVALGNLDERTILYQSIAVHHKGWAIVGACQDDIVCSTLEAALVHEW